MERLTYFDGGKWRLKIGDTEYSGEAVDRLAAYEGTGLEPEEILSAVDMAKIACALHELNAYKELGQIYDQNDLKQKALDAYREGLRLNSGLSVKKRIKQLEKELNV